MQYRLEGDGWHKNKYAIYLTEVFNIVQISTCRWGGSGCVNGLVLGFTLEDWQNDCQLLK